MSRFFFALALLLAASALLPAHAAGTVTDTLRVIRVIRQADGSEHKENASAAKPGDVLEYQATYSNGGGDPVRRLLATIPIPAGSTFVSNSTLPANAEASLDGVTFSAIPLRRQVLESGVLVDRPIPNGEYRFVRWALDDLPPGSTIMVSVRVTVSQE